MILEMLNYNNGKVLIKMDSEGNIKKDNKLNSIKLVNIEIIISNLVVKSPED
jgi:hypothetical protein